MEGKMATKEKSFKMISLADITILPEIQIRIKLDESHVEEIKEALDDGVDIDPIDLFLDSEDRKILGDGMHRYTAYINSKRDKIPANVHEDNPADAVTEAIEFSLKRNCHHGLRMSTEDKRRAVWVALSNNIIRRRGDAPIAALCGVSAGLVKKIRADNVDPTAAPARKKAAKKKASSGSTTVASTPEPEQASPIEERIKTIKEWISDGYMDWQTAFPLFETRTHQPVMWPKAVTSILLDKDGKRTRVPIKAQKIVRKGTEFTIEFEVDANAVNKAKAGVDSAEDQRDGAIGGLEAGA
jgi:anti-sigma28 factor (negative regulator of flagellin synthesis)